MPTHGPIFEMKSWFKEPPSHFSEDFQKIDTDRCGGTTTPSIFGKSRGKIILADFDFWTT